MPTHKILILIPGWYIKYFFPDRSVQVVGFLISYNTFLPRFWFPT